MMVDQHFTVHIPELTQLGAQIMASLADIQGHIADLGGTVHNIGLGLETVRTEIQALKAQIAAGGVLKQADLDALDASVRAVQTEATSIMATEDTL